MLQIASPSLSSGLKTKAVAPSRLSAQKVARRVVLVRSAPEESAEPAPKIPEVQKAADGTVYADDVAAQQRITKPKDNMSPEMKKKLREEYLGLGGAEGQKMGGNYFLNIMVAISSLVVFCKITGVIDF